MISAGLPCGWFERCGGDDDDGDVRDARYDDVIPNATIAIPHFGVLGVGREPITSERSPPTFAHGRHAIALSSLLSPSGIRVETVASRFDIEALAVRKLIWSSAMWLLCHDKQEEEEEEAEEAVPVPPMDVVSVHETRSDDLRALVEEELIPAANALLLSAAEDLGVEGGRGEGGGGGGGGGVGTADEVLSYMESYSRSMPGAVPSKDLAIGEISGRNSVLLLAGSGGSGGNGSGRVRQPRHEGLIRRVAGTGALERALKEGGSEP